MPVRGTEHSDPPRWNAALRWIPDIPVERAELRLTATYAVLPELWVGLEYNPLADDLGLLANWRAVEETDTRPMVMLGTSSDRIGTPSGRAYYLTLAKDLERHVGLPVAPYAGVAYGDYDEELVELVGATVRWHDRVASTHVWDGHNLHHMLDTFWDGGARAGVVVAEQDGKHYVGLSVGLSR